MDSEDLQRLATHQYDDASHLVSGPGSVDEDAMLLMDEGDVCEGVVESLDRNESANGPPQARAIPLAESRTNVENATSGDDLAVGGEANDKARLTVVRMRVVRALCYFLRTRKYY